MVTEKCIKIVLSSSKRMLYQVRLAITNKVNSMPFLGFMLWHQFYIKFHIAVTIYTYLSLFISSLPLLSSIMNVIAFLQHSKWKNEADG